MKYFLNELFFKLLNEHREIITKIDKDLMNYSDEICGIVTDQRFLFFNRLFRDLFSRLISTYNHIPKFFRFFFYLFGLIQSKKNIEKVKKYLVLLSNRAGKRDKGVNLPKENGDLINEIRKLLKIEEN